MQRTEAGAAVAECEGLLPRSTMRVPQPDIIEHFGNADAVPQAPYPVLYTLSPDGCTAHVPDFPKITTQATTLDAALLEVKQQIQKALRQYKNPPIPTKQEQIVVPQNSVLVLVKAS
ncbi:type II toxin-antitoxin system HicB family antitoxin [Gemmiger formicilis]|uniref:type II toxin-antitoxin system HicB family antitoxin n=1 Tax=Gemmiger formicilis TaxID=745368 RepID=UPI003999BA77